MRIVHQLQIFFKNILLPARIAFAIRGISQPVIVEVGANDGKTGDPLYSLIRSKRDGIAVLIEPLPHLFKRLQDSYEGCTHCRFENVAIAPQVGQLPIYFIDPSARGAVPALPPFFEELASFEREKVASVLGSHAVTFLREGMVETIPLDQLLNRANITRVDLLQIDTEGFDYEVLKTFPFTSIKPRLVCFEHCHLTEDNRTASRHLMVSHGYKIEEWGKDFICSRRP